MVQPRILGRIKREAFIGRDDELRQLVRHASGLDDARVLAVAAQPDAGAPELLRQAYDQLFARRGDAIPIYFAFRRGDVSTSDIAPRFFQTVLQQFIAYRRVEPSLCEAQLTFNDLLELALPADYELISSLIQSFRREESSAENLFTFCAGLPQRFASMGRTIFPIIDCLKLRPFRDEVTLAHRLIWAVAGTGSALAVGALRRQAADLLHGFDNGEPRAYATLHIDRFSDDTARRVTDASVRESGIETDDATRDLMIQQLSGSPILIGELLRSASEKKLSLKSFREFGQLYVDELMGGRLQRYFDRMIDLVAPDIQHRSSLLRLLYESATGEPHKSSLGAWTKRLDYAAADFEQVINALHVWELVNSSGAVIEVNSNWLVWLDYLRVQYRLDVAGEPRAQIVASILIDSLKRAPQTMARKYRRDAALGLDKLLPRFNCQSVPASLLHYDRFAALYRGEDDDVIESGLESETELIQLPQIVQVASCSSYSAAVSCDTERCIVAHGFEAGEYADGNEIVWLCAEIDSKLEASRELTAGWCDRLSAFALASGLGRFQVWLIAPQGFSAGAIELLNERGAFGSSHQQFEFLKARVATDGEIVEPRLDEFEMVLPMSVDTEIIAARTAEQIARRVNFQPEAINQIKTAVVEACINAAEHSLSPDRKIYQRFTVEDDRLVITVASRGVLPAQVGTNGRANDQGNGNGRRGWGLKLIKTLMDEVEFERVDDGTQLKMTKYRK
jgi:serine/threonine-protein kinase RsbW